MRNFRRHSRTAVTQYYLSLTPGAWKTFNTEDNSFWCCTGTGVEEYSKLTDSIYWRDNRGIYINLFIPSELNWVEKGLQLRQETNFPQQPGTSLKFTAEKPIELAIRLRVPGWLASAPAPKLNGKPLEAT
ncbi:MAG: glycoside hydrolase family 127 protein, partial [Acidobacteriaceae bacterium]|nr:glycoside hydrolase family 127 protein [Acidobacteriaceae bacterium]